MGLKPNLLDAAPLFLNNITLLEGNYQLFADYLFEKSTKGGSKK
jgi:hypothetical protein